MAKLFNKGIIFFMTLAISSTNLLATQQYPKQYDKMNIKDTGVNIYTYVGESSPTGITIDRENSGFWGQGIFLRSVYETNMNGSVGLAQIVNINDEEGGQNYRGSIGEAFIINQARFFYTTKDVTKGILPTSKYLKPVEYKSKYTNSFTGYGIDSSDARKIVDEYAKENKVAKYYYESLDVMKYDGEYDSTGQRCGYGKMYNLDNDLIYAGMWKDGVFDGYGITFLDNQASYIGDWKDGLPNGMGIIKRQPNTTFYTESYFYMNYLNSVERVGMPSKYGKQKMNGKVSDMPIPFKYNKSLFTVDDMNENRLKEICSEYDEFKAWSEQRIDEIIKYNKK